MKTCVERVGGEIKGVEAQLRHFEIPKTHRMVADLQEDYRKVIGDHRKIIGNYKTIKVCFRFIDNS